MNPAAPLPAASLSIYLGSSLSPPMRDVPPSDLVGRDQAALGGLRLLSFVDSFLFRRHPGCDGNGRSARPERQRGKSGGPAPTTASRRGQPPRAWEGDSGHPDRGGRCGPPAGEHGLRPCPILSLSPPGEGDTGERRPHPPPSWLRAGAVGQRPLRRIAWVSCKGRLQLTR